MMFFRKRTTSQMKNDLVGRLPPHGKVIADPGGLASRSAEHGGLQRPSVEWVVVPWLSPVVGEVPRQREKVLEYQACIA